MLESFVSLKPALLVLIALLNLLSLRLFYSDKRRAQKQQRRIPEKTLLLSAFFFGGIGACLGMQLFRHKTKHRLFQISIPFAGFFTLAALAFIGIKLC